VIDKNYEGSLWQMLGFDAELCQYCKSHLYNGICLNGCSLTVGQYRTMQTGLREAQADIEEADKKDKSP